MNKIVYIVQRGQDKDFFGRVREKLEIKFPGEFNIIDYDNDEIDDKLFEEIKEELLDSKFLIIDAHMGITHFKHINKIIEFADARIPFFLRSGVEDEVINLMDKMSISLELWEKINSYIQEDGVENYFNLFLFLSNHFNNKNYKYDKIKVLRNQCIYTPEKRYYDFKEYIDKATASKLLKIGVLVHTFMLKNDNMDTIDELYNRIASKGAFPIVLVTNTLDYSEYGQYSFQDSLKQAFMDKEEPIVGSIINTMSMSVTVLSNPSDGSQAINKSVFEITKVPIIQAMSTYYNEEELKKSERGLDPMMLACCVYEPEFDGQLIAYPISTKEKKRTKFGEKNYNKPIIERVERIVSLAYNWARLKMIKPEDMKIALILHNMPPRNDMIGCAYGLDTPSSLFNMLKGFDSHGIHLEKRYANGDEIINEIIDGLTNDSRWMINEEVYEKSVDNVSFEEYEAFYNYFSDSIKSEIEKDWGSPIGNILTFKDKILIPGILNGNVFIGLQPPRGTAEQGEKIYHDTRIVMPHQYIGFYRWIEEIYKADIIFHLGTHGTLEWLPGKEIGLSNECYPDINIGTLPHLYIYNIGVVGEGMQAKRRSYSSLIGHMVPSMRMSGSYGEINDIDDAMVAFYDTKINSPNKIEIPFDKIWEIAKKNNFNEDINWKYKPESHKEIYDYIEKLHVWIENIKQSEVKDGLHILGEIKDRERFKNLVRIIGRVRNNEVPSLREAVGDMMGLDYQHLIENPAFLNSDGKTNMMLIDEIDQKIETIMDELDKNNYLFEEDDYTENKMLNQVLDFLSNKVAKNLNKVELEIENSILGLSGGFISPGPSGNPSRGNGHILPTGRNFYSIDPSTIPSRVAWEVGKKLADKLLCKELEENSKYPESIAIVVYAGETMKTHGEDIAEIMYLLGVRPVWLEGTDKVIDLEVIPLEELGRPRIDVVLRISGLFRDTFPNMIERVEDAINLVASLDEDFNSNYIKKHIKDDMDELLSMDMSYKEALIRAKARIFGCPPNTYGSGVGPIIENKKWETKDDLGRVYIQWSGYAYGRELKGESFHESFKKNLSRTRVTVKNTSSIETDMLDSDDFYNYHGGLIAATKSVNKDSKINSYSPNTSDINNIQSLKTQDETARIFRSRINNPKWIEGLKKHGYKGAQEISSMVDIVFGWDATSDIIKDWMYEDICKNFVFNEENRGWMEDVNPWAMNNIVETLLEASQRKMWDGKKETIEKLREIYLESEGLIEDIL